MRQEEFLKMERRVVEVAEWRHRPANVYTRDGLALVGINQMEEPGDITPFLEQYRLSFPVALDTKGVWNQRYRVLGLPTTYFINRQGVIRDVVFGGPMDPALLESKIDALLRE